MSLQSFDAFNEAELNKNIEKLKEQKLTSTIKLNFLRDQATESMTYIQQFEAIENKLFIIDHAICELGNDEKNRKIIMAAGLGDEEQSKEGVQKALKTSMSLVARLDILGEDVVRLKFRLEELGAGGGGSGTGSGSGHSPGAGVREPSIHDRETPPSKKQKVTSAPHPKVKKEECLPKRVEARQWAPEGYYHVKSHFRRLPRRKIKTEQLRNEDKPARYEIVDVEYE
ncbi:hypothetical protein EG329_004265 [Mollisiaceae sp. DMI_Dod_QoI]|nr:hypothetical protein EG329_004265 [Helotiales sp. DMI_Dod_QoI]